AAGLSANATGVNVLCFGNSTGSADLTVSGGTTPYSYSWSNGATTEDISGLTAGTYTVTVTDASGCTNFVSVVIAEPAVLSISLVGTTASFGSNNATITSTVTGGTAPYSYSWSNGATTSDIVNVSPGSYVVTVTDANGCMATDSILITEFARLEHYVWLDENRDGIQDGTEAGVSGITVTVYNDLNVPVASTMTDAFGYAYFGNLTPATYKVRFILPMDYQFTTPNSPGSNNFNDSDADTLTGKSVTFILNNSENKTDIDAGIYFTPVVDAGLGDYVWLDTNQNGIQDALEKGVANITVTLLDGNDNILQSTVTNASGYYHFADLTPGIPYKVKVTLPLGYDFTTANQGANDNIDSDINVAAGSTHGKSDFVTLSNGEDNLSIDAGIYFLDMLKASIGDYVWNDLNQDGIQNQGEPGVEGVKVMLYDDLGNYLTETTTDVFGRYIFTNLTASVYSLSFTDIPSGWSISNANAGVNDELDSDINSLGVIDSVLISAGDRQMSLDAGIFNPLAGTASIGNYVWMDTNQDGIQNAGEPGVAGVTVVLLNSTNTPVVHTTTNASGYYLFAGLDAGSYSVRFENIPAGMNFTGRDQGGNDALDSDASITSGLTTVVSIISGQNYSDLDAGLIVSGSEAGNATIGDYVWNDLNNNGIQEAGEPGVGEITVILTDLITGNIETTVTDECGYYIFNGLNPGNYTVTFVPSSLPSGYSFVAVNNGTDNTKDSDVNPSNGVSSAITLVRGETNASIDAGIHNPLASAQLGDKVWYDVNTNGVQDSGELGVGGITVNLLNGLGQRVRTTMTNSGGNYLFTGLTAGDYIVEFTNIPSGYEFTSRDSGGNDGTDSDAEVVSGKTGVYTLLNGASELSVDAGIFSTTRAALGNYVWSDSNNNGVQDASEEAVPGVTVTVYDNNGAEIAHAVTNADGLYFFSNLNPGVYQLGFSTIPDGITFTGQNLGGDDNTDSDVNPATGLTDAFTLSAGEINTSLDAGLGSPFNSGLFGLAWFDYTGGLSTTLNGNGIQNAGESQIIGVTVQLLDNAGNLQSTTVTGVDGQYHFDGLQPGNYQIVVVKPLGTRFTVRNKGTNDMIDSDVDINTGNAGVSYTTIAGVKSEAADAGIIPPANISGIVFRDGMIGVANTADGFRNTQDPNDPSSLPDRGLGGVDVLLIDVATDSVVRTTRTVDGGRYIFTNVDASRLYKVAFVLSPFACAGCDLTVLDADGNVNDTTDSDANPDYLYDYILYGTLTKFVTTEILPPLIPMDTLEYVDAGYRYPGSAFPVELLYFTAELQGLDGLLKWQTNTEINSSFFAIERSLDNGISFETLGDVPAAGNSMSPRNYQYSDYNVATIAQGKIHYRLKMVDIDNTYKYSNIVELKLNDDKQIYANVYPIPAQSELFVDYQLYGALWAELRIVNEIGQVLYTSGINAGNKPEQITLDIRDWAQGVYYIQIYTEEKSITKKFIKN
ncbi:MAG: carboxypeptidase regulatory-like domain-containing protein, partial [Bacteroidia bacterium]|nr:carboxypeptidase regulatory-like domain-containing protein [Bacteroidia bacterium]